MLHLLVQSQTRRGGHSLLATLGHLGAAGLFFLGIVDSSPLPTFGGADILTVVLAASHRKLWYEYAASVTAGSVLGAYLTFRLARTAGSAYLDKKFNKGKVSKFLKIFKHGATGTLIASTAIPLPTPTSMFFAAAGAGDYPLGRFLAIVLACRAVRYFGVAFLAAHYGQGFLGLLRHPLHHWGWLAFLVGMMGVLITGGVLASRRLETFGSE